MCSIQDTAKITQLSMEFTLLTNVCHFIIISLNGLSDLNLKTPSILAIFLFIRSLNFILYLVLHEKYDLGTTNEYIRISKLVSETVQIVPSQQDISSVP